MGKNETVSLNAEGELVWIYFTKSFKSYCVKHADRTYSLNVVTNDNSFKYQIKQQRNSFGSQMVSLTKSDGIFNLQY